MVYTTACDLRALWSRSRVGAFTSLPMVRQLTILLVEDASAVRDAFVEILRARDCKILTAADGYEAIHLLTLHYVDLLLTDIKMPGLSGYELAAQAKLLCPFLKVLYTTGYDGNEPG